MKPLLFHKAPLYLQITGVPVLLALPIQVGATFGEAQQGNLCKAYPLRSHAENSRSIGNTWLQCFQFDMASL